jgi:hypothetical protein
MTVMSNQSEEQAAEAFVGWLHDRVMAAARGDGLKTLDTEPGGTFWLGRLAPEVTVQNSSLGKRGERLDPCAVGLRVRPEHAGPWTFTVDVGFVTWTRNAASDWVKNDRIERSIPVTVPAATGPYQFGQQELTADLHAQGMTRHAAGLRVDVESWKDQPELVITLVNEGQEKSSAYPDTHLYEATVEVTGLSTLPFELEALPETFRYDRRIPAFGINVGVEATSGGLRTTDVVVTDRGRPTYGITAAQVPDLTFATLARDPLPEIGKLVTALRAWGEENWSSSALEALDDGWTEDMRVEADREAAKFDAEVARLERGLDLLAADPRLLRAFKLANEAIAHAANGRYHGWRAFQLGFLVGAVVGLVEPADADTVDTVWFATGGGKTETYLGLLVTSVLYDRLTGKGEGISAWSRFPLRMLSLQQTQRFADALAGAELMRQRERLGGDPIALGFFVGTGGTPNAIPLDPKEGEPDPNDPGMPAEYQVLMRCPFCRSSDITMHFDRARWTLQHRCTNSSCPWKEDGLPFYAVDQEIYRFLPAVVVGTLDKAALLGMQAAMRGFVGAPRGVCSRPGHGYCYSPRRSRPTGCLVPGCRGERRTVTQPRERWAPTLRLQDELHLLRDSLGAVGSHYEAALDHLQEELGGRRAKVVASSATLEGFERQVDVLYQRDGRVFPQPGPSAGRSFWSHETTALARRFVAVAPRGVTMEFVSDRTLTVLQQGVRQLLHDSEQVCREAGIDPRHIDHLLSLYGVNVVYGNTLRDVEAARRSIDTQIPLEVQAETLTGGTDFDTVRETLRRLEKPEADFQDRLHIIAASSMLSHGVDIERLNTMVMLGIPLTTAEFIQTTARVGRRWPGLVYVLHRIGREREQATFSQFDSYVRQGDRFVEPVPITRRSRRVLSLTISGIVEARRLALHEPRSGQALTTVTRLRSYHQDNGTNQASEAAVLARALGFDGPLDEMLTDDIEGWMHTYFSTLNDPATTVRWPNELSPSGPVMRSLRDVEESAPVVGDD